MHRLLTLAIALATLLLALSPGHRAPELQPAPSQFVAARHTIPVRVLPTRVVERVTRGLAHRVQHVRARALHERETDEAITDDDLTDDLRDGRDAAWESDAHATKARVRRRACPPNGPSRTEPARDPSRFAVGCGLPRGPPARTSFLRA